MDLVGFVVEVVLDGFFFVVFVVGVFDLERGGGYVLVEVGGEVLVGWGVEGVYVLWMWGCWWE